MLRLSAADAARIIGSKKTTDKPKGTTASKRLKAERKKAQAYALARDARVMLAPLPPHKTEYIFHHTRRWRFDYAWPELLIAMEVHGGIYTGGRHTNGKGFTEDRVKMNSAAVLGWHVLEVTPEHIKNGIAKQWLEQLIQRKLGNDGNDASDV